VAREGPNAAFGRSTPDAGDERLRLRTVLGRNGPQQARKAVGEGERAGRMHQTQDMIGKEHPDGRGAEDSWGDDSSSGQGRYASRVSVVFADIQRCIAHKRPDLLVRSANSLTTPWRHGSCFRL